MASNADIFLSKTLGEDFMESLAKVELYKPGTRTTLDHEEIKTALQIVPRTIMAMLIKELTPMEIGETKEIKLFVGKDAHISATKHERDVFSGEVIEDNKKIAEFKFRSIPGIGLILMSTFELYDMDNLINSDNQSKDDKNEGVSEKVQRMIDDRLALHDLIGQVVDKKIMERDAINKLVLAKLTETLALAHKEKNETPTVTVPDSMIVKKEASEAPKKKTSPVKDFLESRKNKKPKEHSIEMVKGETVSCNDCQQEIFKGEIFSGCICLGDNRESKLFIKKTEDGIKVRFGRGWDEENIEMLLETLRKK